MHTTTVRVLCSLLGLVAALLAYWAFVRDDLRDLIGYVALALLALVLWISVRPGAAKLLEGGTSKARGTRTALYAIMLVGALVATARWPAGLDDGRGSDAAVVLMMAAWMTGRFLPREKQREITS